MVVNQITKWACKYDLASSVCTFGANVENPVAAVNYVGVVFDHDHAVAAVDQLSEMAHQACDIRRV